jgi:hypothetical protein
MLLPQFHFLVLFFCVHSIMKEKMKQKQLSLYMRKNSRSDILRSFTFKREFVSKKFIHNKMEKYYTLLFNVVPVDCHTLVPTFWKLHNSIFKGFRLLVYPTLHSCNDLINIKNLLPPKTLFIGPNK